MAQLHGGSSQLELEAAHFFKLDPNQLNLCSKDRSNGLFGSNPSSSSEQAVDFEAVQHQCKHPRRHHHRTRHQRRQDSKMGKYGHMPKECHMSAGQYQGQVGNSRATMSRRSGGAITGRVPATSIKGSRMPAQSTHQTHSNACSSKVGANLPKTNQQIDGAHQHKPSAKVTGSKSSSVSANKPAGSPQQLNVAAPALNCSSTASSNSLPSISSSPSVSPSIVCPHLSLDDLLEFRQGARSVSPHTIGLCPRCRLDPPPNVHSPLSPMFKPFAYGQRTKPAGRMNHSTSDLRSTPNQRATTRTRHQAIGRNQASCYTKNRSLSNITGGDSSRRRQANLRDDSLDYCLEPAELRRLQMSPTLRNSVEFIRKNSIESGRVVKIYKNGEPYEKPLRICVLRGEFANINHFLDHVSTRLLVPLGARYLFHLDGQLVYSVQELKHGSTYIVSGTRCFDYRASNLLKEQQKKEQSLQNKTNRQHDGQLTKAHTPNSTPNGARVASKTPAANRARDYQANNKPVGRISANRTTVGRLAAHYNDNSAATFQSCDSLNGQILDNNEPSRSLTRAKSELSALPRKQKKNVTFMDTGRGSSPAISDSNHSQVATEIERHLSKEQKQTQAHGLSQERRQTKQVYEQTVQQQVARANNVNGARPRRTGEMAIQAAPVSHLKGFNRSDVGIQVSDSIDGFLIDLPVALPARGDDSNLRGRRVMARGQDGQTGSRGTRQAAGSGVKRRQIVTITERQLSLEEMNELRDLSQGDHHHEPIGELEQEASADETTTTAEGSHEAGVQADEAEIVPDFTNTIAIGSDPQVDSSTQVSSIQANGTRVQANGSSRLVTSSVAQQHNRNLEATAADERWQYPGGRTTSATPTERPVSQSGPNETVRARVTTPTPSLSTAGGDENSLSMSYETNLIGEPQQPSPKPRRSMPLRVPQKKRMEVVGALYPGLHAPERNFRLLWVNGFTINDLYPENSVSEQQLLELEARGDQQDLSSPNGGRRSHLSPDYSKRRGTNNDERPAAAFKPSERYHNWICHSRRHDELIYPAGSLVILWCQWTNEQRFYSKHTANVSAVALATLDLDLVASAQVCELYEQPQICANVHLWSITDLSTLMVVEHEQLRTKLIFSLRLKNTRTGGCELSIGARDEKQLLLFTFHQKSIQTNGEGEAPAQQPILADKTSKSPKRRFSRDQTTPIGVCLRANKVIQSNQIPLFIMKVPSFSSEYRVNSTGKQQKPEVKCEPVICFGRRCFQIWSADVKQQKFRPMQQEGKTSGFASLISKANCLCRLSPSELLIGDSDGNIALLATSLYASGATSGESANKRTPTKTNLGQLGDLKYGVETIALLGPLATGSNMTKLATATQGKTPAAITCLTRVTGSLFISADTTCAIRFWKIQQQSSKSTGAMAETSIPTIKLSSDISSKGSGKVQCEQLASISLPPDLGFVCTVLLANYQRVDSLVEFYIVSTCNTILFGSVKLKQHASGEPGVRELLANSSLSVVYEGHETSASSLVADFQATPTRAQMILNKSSQEQFYFTCSLDCRICKWNGRQLVWKSMLPSACVSLAVHPVGFVLAVGSIDGTVYILDKVSGLLVAYFPLTPVRINCLAYSSDGSLLAAGCANGSIFILPVYERGLKYKKVSIFQSPNAVVSLQFSLDNRFMLTSVTRAQSQELILWDLPNFRYMRDNVKLVADKIAWFDSICSGSEDVRAIWENANLAANMAGQEAASGGNLQRAGFNQKRPSGLVASTSGDVRRVELKRDGFVINLSCHRLIKTRLQPGDTEPKEGNYVIASDTRGFLRLFRYPSYDIRQGFQAARISSSAVNCCRFLNCRVIGDRDAGFFVSTSLDGSICLWALE